MADSVNLGPLPIVRRSVKGSKGRPFRAQFRQRAKVPGKARAGAGQAAGPGMAGQ